jgi:hypothetical protein
MRLLRAERPCPPSMPHAAALRFTPFHHCLFRRLSLSGIKLVEAIRSSLRPASLVLLDDYWPLNQYVLLGDVLFPSDVLCLKQYVRGVVTLNEPNEALVPTYLIID